MRQATSNAGAENRSQRPTLTRGIGEVVPIVGQVGVDLGGIRLDEVSEEVGGTTPCSLLVQFGAGELRGPIDGEAEREPTLCRTDFSDIDVGISRSGSS